MQYLGAQCMEFVTESFVVQLGVIGDDTQVYSLYKFFVLSKTRHGYFGSPGAAVAQGLLRPGYRDGCILPTAEWNSVLQSAQWS